MQWRHRSVRIALRGINKKGVEIGERQNRCHDDRDKHPMFFSVYMLFPLLTHIIETSYVLFILHVVSIINTHHWSHHTTKYELYWSLWHLVYCGLKFHFTVNKNQTCSSIYSQPILQPRLKQPLVTQFDNHKNKTKKVHTIITTSS